MNTKAFAQKWLAKFQDPNICYIDLVDRYLADDCKMLGFEMDCGHAFHERYGAAVYNARELSKIVDEIDDIQLLGSAIYSRWRYFNHWAYSGAEILEPENREWFIIALKQLEKMRCKMTKETKGVIYILTNPSFKEYVKIGYADDMKSRLAQLNRSECTPFAFRVYATYEVDARLTDMKIHDIIDKLNPDLRAIDNVEGKKRVREFYAMTAADAYGLFEAMAEIHGTTHRLKLIEPSAAEAQEAIVADEIAEDAREKAKPFTFALVNIPVGEKVTFFKDDSIFCTVVSDKKVDFNGEVMSLTMAARLIMGLETTAHIAGPRFFKYKGEMLNDIRERLGV